jgi:hypothetical protein
VAPQRALAGPPSAESMLLLTVEIRGTPDSSSTSFRSTAGVSVSTSPRVGPHTGLARVAAVGAPVGLPPSTTCACNGGNHLKER